MRLLMLLALIVSAGCSSHNVNPTAPRAHTGYVDFYTDSSMDLSWEVKREAGKAGEMRTVFSEFQPVKGTILRLAAPPGTNHFQVWFINEVTEGPQRVSVPVEEGKVTPVHITLTPAGSTSVENKSYEYRPTARATRRVTRLATGESVTFKIGAVPQGPVEYQTKEQMPYWSLNTR